MSTSYAISLERTDIHTLQSLSETSCLYLPTSNIDLQGLSGRFWIYVPEERVFGVFTKTGKELKLFYGSDGKYPRRDLMYDSQHPDVLRFFDDLARAKKKSVPFDERIAQNLYQKFNSLVRTLDNARYKALELERKSRLLSQILERSSL